MAKTTIQFWNEEQHHWDAIEVTDLTIVHQDNCVATAKIDGKAVFIQGGLEDVDGAPTWEAFDAEMSGLSDEELREIGFQE